MLNWLRKVRMTTIVMLVAMLLVTGVQHSAAVAQGFSKSFHFVWRDEGPGDVRDAVLMLRDNGFSKIYIALTQSTCLSYDYWDCSSARWSDGDLKGIIDFARSNGLDVALEIKMINKVKKSFRHLDSMLFNDETLDPDHPAFEALNDATFRYVSKALGVTEVLIGYDEIYGFSGKDKESLRTSGQQMLGPNQFVRGLTIARSVAARYGIQIAIWGDMLIDNANLACSPSRHNHGSSTTGYGQNLLPYIPRQIAIIAWYYKDTSAFCGIDQLRDYGFPVRAGTFQANETRRALVAFAKRSQLPEMVYTSFRFFRSNKIKNSQALCEFLELGPCRG